MKPINKSYLDLIIADIRMKTNYKILMWIILFFLISPENFSQKMVRFQDKSGLWGYKDKISGEVKINPIYDYAWEFSDSTATICMGCKHIKDDLWKVGKGAEYREINNKGNSNSVSTSTVYFTDNLSIIQGDNSAFAVFTGQEDLSFEYQDIEPLYPFTGNFLLKKNNDNYGMINSKGEKIFAVEYSNITSEDGIYFTLTKGKYGSTKSKITHGIADKNGKLLVPFGDYYLSAVHNGVSACSKLVGEIYKYGIIDTNNTIIAPFKYDRTYSFYNGVIPVCIKCTEGYVGDWQFTVGGTWGIVDKNGKEIIPPVEGKDQIDQIFPFQEGMALFCKGCKFTKSNSFREGPWKGGKYGFIDSLGKISIPAVYDSAGIFCDGLAKVITKNNGKRKVGFIDRTGKEIFPLSDKYSDIDFFIDGISVAKKGNKYGIIDISGKEVVPFKYDYAEYFYYKYFPKGIFEVELKKKRGLINNKGEIILPLVYDYIRNDYYDTGLFEVTKDGKTYKVNSKNETVSDN